MNIAQRYISQRTAAQQFAAAKVVQQPLMIYQFPAGAVMRTPSYNATFDGSDRCTGIANIINPGTYDLSQGTTARMLAKFTDRFGNIALQGNGVKGLGMASQITNLHTSSYTIFYVVKFDASAALNVAFIIGAQASGLYHFRIGGLLYPRNNNNTGLDTILFAGNSDSSLIVVCIRKNVGVLGELFINGNLQTSTTSATFINSFTNGAMVVGADASYANGLIGLFYDLAIFNTVLSDTEVFEASMHLQQRYGYGMV